MSVTRKDVLVAIAKAIMAGGDSLAKGEVVSAVIKTFATFSTELAASSKEQQQEILAPPTDDELNQTLAEIQIGTSIAVKNTEILKKMVRKSYQLITKDLHNQNILLNEIDKNTYDNSQKLKKVIEKLNRFYPDIIASLEMLHDDHDLINDKLDNIDQKIDNLQPSVIEEDIREGIHNIPYPSLGSLFKGRDDDLKTLVKQINSDSDATAITQAIRGLGGIGKTRLAVEYSWKTLKDGTYSAVLFVNCSQETADQPESEDIKKQQNVEARAKERLYNEIAKLASPNLLNIAIVKQMDPESAAQTILKELQKRSNWLLVFDNVDESAMAAAVTDVLPQLSAGKVILTSRLKHFASSVRSLEIEKLSPKASKEYLLAKTKKARPTHDNDSEKLVELAKKLDGLPVALEQAAAYIIYEELSFEQYLEKFDAMEKKLLSFDAKSKNLADYPKSVLMTWSLTTEQLTPIAQAVHTLAAFLAPDAIPQNLFILQAEGVLIAASELDSNFNFESHINLPETEKADTIEEAFADLAAFSMITRITSENTFNIHRLVQQVTRLQLSKESIKDFTQLILSMIHRNQPDQNETIKTNYAWYTIMDSHLSGLITFTETLWPKLSDIPDLIIGPLANMTNNLAQMYKAMNRLAEAETLMMRALKIDETSYGKDHPKVASVLNNLASLYLETNRLAEAETLMIRALKIDEASSGKDHPDVARDLNNLASLYQTTNRLAEAEPLMLRGFQIFETSYGKDHPNVATACNNLAALYQDTNRLAEAETLMMRALKITEATFKKDHPEMATRLNNLAMLYLATNRRTEAEPLLKRTLKITEASYGKNHPIVAKACNNLALLYEETNHLAEAEPLMKRALKITEASYGKDHPDVATNLNNLAHLYFATNRLAEAEPLSRRHLEIFIAFTRSTGHPHPHLHDAINNYSILLMEMGHTEDQVTEKLKALASDLFDR